MQKIFFIFLISIFLISSLVLAEKISVKDLPKQYRKWIEEDVGYIISPTEKDVFLQLKTDRERTLFIEAFWKHRDPTTGTPKNEFKEEHYRRIQYANRIFGRTALKPGWKTDRGHYYILLGEPREIERITGETEVYNSEIWFYQGLSHYGLPAGFHLVFYQKGGVGDYFLYSPTSNGPQALLTTYSGSQIDYLEAFRALRKINLNLAEVSLSLIPGEHRQLGRPSLASDILIKDVSSVPQKQFKDTYAEKFLMYKDIVEVDYSANYIDNNSIIVVIKNLSGIYFVHYIIELKKLSVDLYQGKYVTNFMINGKISDLKGKTIYQYENSIPIEFSETQLKEITYSPFDIYDMFPLLPGQYKFSALLKNEVSKEFTSIEKDILIPQDEPEPRMSSLILGHKIQPKEKAGLSPFKLGENQIYCLIEKIFQRKEKLYVSFQILGLNQQLEKKGLLKYEISNENESVLTLTRKLSELEDRLNFQEEFLLQEFPPGYYRINVILTDGNSNILSKSEPFAVTSASAMPRPFVYSKKLLPVTNPAYSLIIGNQYYNKGELEKARIQFEKAYQSQPDSMEYGLNLARTYFVLKEYEKAKQVLLPFLESPKPNYNVYLILGETHQVLGEFDKAISVHNKALTHFGVNSILLNSLGECYYRLGKTEEALVAWENSLKINPAQPELKEKVESLKKKNTSHFTINPSPCVSCVSEID